MKQKTRWAYISLAVAVPLLTFWAAQQAASWRPHEVFRLSRSPAPLTLSPHNNLLLVGNQMWDFKRHVPLRSLNSLTENFAGFYNDTSYWSTHETSSSFTLARRDTASGRVLWHAQIPAWGPGFVQDVALSPDFRSVISVYNGSLYFLDARTGKPTHVQKIVGMESNCFIADRGRELVGWYWNNRVRLCARTLTTKKPLWDIGWDGDAWLNDADIGTSPNGGVIWSVGDYRERLVFLDARTGKRLWSSPFVTSVNSEGEGPLFVFSRDSQFVAIANATGIQVLETRTGKRLGSRPIPGIRSSLTMELENNATALYTHEPDGRVLRWRLR